MRKIIYFIFILLLSQGFLMGQNIRTLNPVKLTRDYSIHPVHSSLIRTSVAGAVKTTSDGPGWNRQMISYKKEHYLPPAVLAEIKRKTELKKQLEHQNSPNTPEVPGMSPKIGVNMHGNSFDGYTPPDNSIAIANNGVIVSVINSNIEYYDNTGQLYYSKSFVDFFGNDPELTGTIYDPVVIYDSEADRFFMVVLHGSESQISKVLVCFTQSGNIADGWWYYKLSGNPLSAGHWFDYPKVGFTDTEVLVTGNLFFDNGNFSESVIYQIQKAEGYAGQDITWQYWTGISNTPFTIVPASNGHQGAYGSGLYFITTLDDNSGDKIELFHLTNSIGGNPQIEAFQTATNFTLAGNAMQKGSQVVLNTDDTRGLNAFYLNGIIHFVFNSEYANGYTGINYNRLDVNSLTLQGSIFGLEGYDYCYPSVASFATSPSDKSVMIAFSRSGSDIYPECRVVQVDNDGNWSSSSLVKEGETYVDVYQSDGITRWGDYSGIARKHNAVSPEVWTSGCFGYFSLNEHSFDTWIAQVNGMVIGVPEKKPAVTEVRIFPNPVMDMFSLDFVLADDEMITIRLSDINGKEIRVLYHDRVRDGKNRFSFNKGMLKPGIYFITIEDATKKLAHEKIVVQ